MDSASHLSPTTFGLEPLQPQSVDDGSRQFVALGLVPRMLTTFAKTSNVSNKPGLTLENAGDYRDLTVLLSVLALHIPSWKMLENVGKCWTRI